jgi:hypothetical protein
MDKKPKRRWFRFRLSTVLILTAIVAWGMACRPYVVHYVEVSETRPQDIPPGSLRAIPMMVNLRRTLWTVHRENLNPGLKWPALALAAFFTWKAGWAVVERRRQSASPE